MHDIPNATGPRRRASDFPPRSAAAADLDEVEESMGSDIDDAVLAGQRDELLPVLPIPIFLSASGTYEWSQSIKIPPVPVPIPNPPIPRPIPRPGPLGQAEVSEAATAETMRDAQPSDGIEYAAVNELIMLRERLCLDIDGRYPQMLASGTLYQFMTERTHWIARIARQSDGSYAGPIWYTSGNVTSFPYTQVRITVQRSRFKSQRSATVTFRAPGGATRVRTYRWNSAYIHPCELEYDTVAGATAVTQYHTGSHPNRPAALASELLSIETVFRRAGFNVSRAGDSPIPVTGAGSNGRWSVAEMHDAMQQYWSRFANRPQWAVWTLFASLADQGTSLGGIMFDDIGPNHRQGTAVFSDSFIAQPPSGDPAPAAWVERMRFWTAVHELGHTFNLAHSWQKVHPASWGNSWIPMANEPEARSFMNYPYNVAGGQSAFFASFEYRFSDQELLFMRHAPERFVQQGNAAWFVNHGFEQLRVNDTPSLAFELRSNRMQEETSTSATVPFLDQVVLECKITNRTRDPMLIDEHLLDGIDHLTLVVKREGAAAQVHRPYAQMCWHGARKVLMPGASIYTSLYLSAGKDGFYVSEPGRYVVQAALHLADEDIISNPFSLRVLPPRSYEEAAFAQDLYVPDVGRALAFDGTRVMTSANEILREAIEQFSTHPLATHARVALALPLARIFRTLEEGDIAGVDASRLAFRGQAAVVDEAAPLLKKALSTHAVEAARILGHIDFADYAAQYVEMLSDGGETRQARTERNAALQALSTRGVKSEIIEQVKEKLAGN